MSETKLGFMSGWVVCVVVVVVGWVVVGDLSDEGMSWFVFALVFGSLAVMVALSVFGRRAASVATGIVVSGDSGRPVEEPAQVSRYGQRLDALAPAASGGMVQALGVTGAAEWYQEQAGSCPWDAASTSTSAASPASPEAAAVDRPLLPRRSPTLIDYPLIWEVISGTRSQNEAIRVLWGSKDGKTLAWLTRVRNLYMGEKQITRGDIIVWELGSDDDVEGVAERLGVDVDEVQAVFDGR